MKQLVTIIWFSALSVSCSKYNDDNTTMLHDQKLNITVRQNKQIYQDGDIVKLEVSGGVIKNIVITKEMLNVSYGGSEIDTRISYNDVDDGLRIYSFMFSFIAKKEQKFFNFPLGVGEYITNGKININVFESTDVDVVFDELVPSLLYNTFSEKINWGDSRYIQSKRMYLLDDPTMIGDNPDIKYDTYDKFGFNTFPGLYGIACIYGDDKVEKIIVNHGNINRGTFNVMYSDLIDDILSSYPNMESNKLLDDHYILSDGKFQIEVNRTIDSDVTSTITKIL